MNNKPLLSILIPTKNRKEFANKVILNVLAINDNRLELVIQDNSDTNSLEKQLSESQNDVRLKYFYIPGILSFTDNFSYGIGNCSGEYVTIIGDDDGINPNIVDIATWASKNGIEAITPTLPLIYFWPESGISSVHDQGKLIISDISCKAEFSDTKNEVTRLLKNGCQNYLSYNLAKVYHGMIKRSVLLEIKNITGHFIGGLSPDIYLSIAASLLVKKVLLIDYPLTISGICKRSGSADSATGRHTGNLEQAPHFAGHINYKWSEKVPSFYSVETIWGDSALAALREMNYFHEMEAFNVDVLSAYLYKAYPRFRTLIMDNLKRSHKSSISNGTLKFYLLTGFLKGPILYLLRRIRNRIFNKKKVNTYNGVNDIENASEIINQKIEDKKDLILRKLDLIKINN
jgi:glycosyltransferase involved in cell wall biosynthesis